MDADVDAGEADRERQVSTVAAAKLVAAWPDGNEASVGAVTSGFGSAKRIDGRSTSNRPFSPYEAQSETATARTVKTTTAYRFQRSARTHASTIQTRPSRPTHESP